MMGAVTRPKGSKDRVLPRRKITVGSGGVPPWRQCTATSKRTGERCGAMAVYGAWTCRSHGGTTIKSLEAARRRLEDVLPLAVARLIDCLESADERVVLVAAKDLLDRLGVTVATQLQLSGVISVEPDEAIRELLGRAQELRSADPDHQREREILEHLAAERGLADLPWPVQLRRLHEEVVGVPGELEIMPALPLRTATPSAAPSAAGDELEPDDAEVVDEPDTTVVVPADPAFVTLSSGERVLAVGLRPGGGRSSR